MRIGVVELDVDECVDQGVEVTVVEVRVVEERMQWY